MHDKVGMSNKEKKELIKNLIHKLHAGENPLKVKEEFKEVIKNLTQLEISQAEEELVKEGMPPELIHHMCDVHLAALQDALEEQTDLAPPGHPIHILMEEHALLLKYVNRLREIYKEIKDKEGFRSAIKEMQEIVSIIDHLKASESHYLREENILFSYLEKHGVTQPPKIMWMEHDRIRDIEKKLYNIVENKEIEWSEFLSLFHNNVHGLAELLAGHFGKENRVLFPTAIQVCSDEEWAEMREQFDELGYCCFTPERDDFGAKKKKEKKMSKTDENIVDLGSGLLTLEQIELIFNHLPVDVTFVDKNDEVKFFNEGPERIFARTRSIIGRLVENCHPNKSLHLVNRIVEGFKDGSMDTAEFWLTLDERLIYIRYFPVKNKNNEYEGILEVTQDITDIKKIEGEKRLL